MLTCRLEPQKSNPARVTPYTDAWNAWPLEFSTAGYRIKGGSEEHLPAQKNPPQGNSHHTDLFVRDIDWGWAGVVPAVRKVSKGRFEARRVRRIV